MLCKKCDEENAKNAKFCNKCGEKFNSIVETEKVQEIEGNKTRRTLEVLVAFVVIFVLFGFILDSVREMDSLITLIVVACVGGVAIYGYGLYLVRKKDLLKIKTFFTLLIIVSILNIIFK